MAGAAQDPSAASTAATGGGSGGAVSGWSASVRDWCREWRLQSAAAAAALAMALAGQWGVGAYRCEFGGHPDEAAHYVTGLMIRDYLLTGLPEHPMRFARRYYGHYPKVALGNWPPGFYLLQAPWTALFSPRRGAVMALMAVLTALLGLAVFHGARAGGGVAAGAVAGTLLLSLPLVRSHSALVMTEIPVAGWCFLAAWAYGRYLRRPGWGWSLGFALLASAAIMTKGTALALALVPPLCVVATGRLRLLGRWDFWAAAVVVAVLCGPWMWLTLDLARAGWLEGRPSAGFVVQAVPYYLRKLVLAAGPVGVVAGAVGVVAWWRRGRDEVVLALIALGVSVLLFQCVVPCGLEPRHLVTVLPVVAVLAGQGAVAAGGAAPQRVWLPVLAALLGLWLGRLRSPQKGYWGFRPVAVRAVTDGAMAESRLLVSSDARGEGMLISEVAMAERRPGHVVHRSSKLLASSSWSGSGYDAKVATTAALVAALAEARIDLVVMDRTVPERKRRPHHDLLAAAVDAHPERFERLGSYTMVREAAATADGIGLYRFRHGGAQPAD